MRFFLVLVLLLLACSRVVGSADEIEQFLQTRTLLSQVFFANHSTVLSADAKAALDAISDSLKQRLRDGEVVRVEGFASPPGDTEDNLKLSFRRALAVKDYLREKHQVTLEVFLGGFGESAGLTDKIAESRRVDIAVYEKNRPAKVLFDDGGKVERFIIR